MEPKIGSLNWDVVEFEAVEDKEKATATADCIISIAHLAGDEETLKLAAECLPVVPGEKITAKAVSAFITRWKMEVQKLPAQKSLLVSVQDYFNETKKQALMSLSFLTPGLRYEEIVKAFCLACSLNREVVGRLKAASVEVEPIPSSLMALMYERNFINRSELVLPPS